MLIETVRGKDVYEALKIVEQFFAMMKEKELDDKYIDTLGDISTLHFTNDMPARIKCATLSWHSANVILSKIKKRLEIEKDNV